MATGECYGWTALRPVLLDSGLFKDSTAIERAQLMNAVATMGIAANALCKLPLGYVLDRYGPRVTSVIGALIMITGSLLFGLCDDNDHYTPKYAYFMLGMAGPFLQMPCFQFSELFGHRKATAMAYLITCFELSTGMFWIFGELDIIFGLKRKELFVGYAFVGVYCLITGIMFWPDAPFRQSHPPPPQKPPAGQENKGPGAPGPVRAPVNRNAHLMDKPLLTQVCSVPFAYVTIFLCVHIFRQGFLLGTLGPQVEYFFTDAALANKLKDSFNIILPLGFLPMMFCTASGFAGYVLNRPNLAFIVVTLMSMVYGGLLLVPNVVAFIVLFVVFPVARQFVFSTFFSFSANTFGYASFGRIAGVASTIAGLVQLTQTALVAAVEEPGSWLNWYRIDLIFLLLPMILFIYPVTIYVIEYYEAKKSSEDGVFISEDGTDQDDQSYPLMGRSDNSRRSDDRADEGRGGVPIEGDSPAGAPISMSYAEASSYGSHSASSFAALYSKYVTEDIKVPVHPVTPDHSIHVSSLDQE